MYIYIYIYIYIEREREREIARDDYTFSIKSVLHEARTRSAFRQPIAAVSPILGDSNCYTNDTTDNTDTDTDTDSNCNTY